MSSNILKSYQKIFSKKINKLFIKVAYGFFHVCYDPWLFFYRLNNKHVIKKISNNKFIKCKKRSYERAVEIENKYKAMKKAEEEAEEAASEE